MHLVGERQVAFGVEAHLILCVDQDQSLLGRQCFAAGKQAQCDVLDALPNVSCYEPLRQNLVA